MAFNVKNVIVKKDYTVPALEQKVDVPNYIKFLSKMEMTKEYVKGQIKDKKTGELKDDIVAPYQRADVLNLETGEECNMALGAVVIGILSDTDDFKDDKYVGKCFKICKLAQAKGRRYNNFKFEEIEDQS